MLFCFFIIVDSMLYFLFDSLWTYFQLWTIDCGLNALSLIYRGLIPICGLWTDRCGLISICGLLFMF